MRDRPLTAQQRKVLDRVGEFIGEHGFPPTLKEIGEAIGVANLNAVRGHLAALERKGYLTKSPDKARAIQLVNSPSPVSRMKRRLHEVLGTDQGVFHRVIYGLAWATRDRAEHFTSDRQETMSHALDREASEHGWTVLQKRVEPDHVVVVVEVWPNHSPQQTVRRFQSVARTLARRGGSVSDAEVQWARGYVATTDLEILEELVAKMLGRQPIGKSGEESER